MFKYIYNLMQKNLSPPPNKTSPHAYEFSGVANETLACKVD